MTRARTLADLGSASLATDAEVAAAIDAIPAQPGKNLLYNGAMQVAQRGTSTAGITTAPGGAYYTADRWKFLVNTIGTWTQDIQTDAPTGSGLARSVRLLCTTADAAPAAGDYLIYSQILEGQDLQRVAKGSASAKQLTLSFWVKSNVTGTYVAELRDSDNTRGVSVSYTIGASGTWEKKIVTFPADTTGAFTNDNGASLEVNLWLGAGSTYSSGSLQTTWASLTNANRAVGQTNLAAATNNYWQITGVQLEVGDTATEFEHLPFGVELARCQRYYEKSYNYSVVPGTASDSGAFYEAGDQNSGAVTGNYNIDYKVMKRAAPTFTYYSTNSGAAGYVYNRAVNTFTDKNTGLGAQANGESSFVTSIGSGVGIGNYLPDVNSSIRFQWTADAEL